MRRSWAEGPYAQDRYTYAWYINIRYIERNPVVIIRLLHVNRTPNSLQRMCRRAMEAFWGRRAHNNAHSVGTQSYQFSLDKP